MGMAFGISEDDVLAVASQAGKSLTDERAAEIFSQIDDDLVEASALYFDDLDEQTEAAHDEIRRQVVDLGFGEEVLGLAPAKPGMSAS